MPLTQHRAANGTTTSTTKPSLMSRLRGDRTTRSAETKTKVSHNPITGAETRTTTEKVTSHPHGHNHNNHNHNHSSGFGRNTRSHHNGGLTGTTGGSGLTSSTGRSSHRHGHHSGSNVTGNGYGATAARQPSTGTKMSGAMMKLRGSLTGKPGVKAAGARREHGTDGRIYR